MAGKGPYGYARRHRAIELVCIAGAIAQFCYLGLRLAQGVTTWAGALMIAAALAGGYFAADFISGLAHWTGDTLGDEHTLLIGAHFIAPFRFHHVDPKDITRHGFIETNGNNCIVCVLVLAHVVVLMPRAPGFFFYYGALMLSTALWMFGTNQFHKWAHADRVAPVVRRLQVMGVILSPERHNIHHKVPHDTHYCITSGVLNPLLARIRFFRFMEHMIGLVRPAWLNLNERKRFAQQKT